MTCVARVPVHLEINGGRPHNIHAGFGVALCLDWVFFSPTTPLSGSALRLDRWCWPVNIPTRLWFVLEDGRFSP